MVTRQGGTTPTARMIAAPRVARRALLLGATTLGIVPLGAVPRIAGAQQGYPGRAVRVVNAYSPGGTADVVSRIICARLGERLGQPFTVENRPGAAGTVAAQVVARAQPDGYTLLYDATAHSVNPSLFGNRLPYDTQKDLLPVFLTMVTPNTFVCRQDFAAKTIPELIALAKARPGQIDCATTGVGTVQHVSIELLNHMAGIRITHVPYREFAAARNDLMGGRVPLQSNNVPGSIGLLRTGEIRCLAHCGPPGALAALPGVPAMAETLPGFETWEWNGLFAPAGTPSELIQRLNAECNAVIAEPATLERLNGIGALTRQNTVAEFADFRRQQIAFFERMVAMADIRIE